MAERAEGATAADSLDRHRAGGRAGRGRGCWAATSGRSSPSVRIRRSMVIRAGDPGDQPAVDAGMRWMVDFDEAEAAGMALRIRSWPRISRRSIESLFVLGVNTTATANEGAKQLGEQLDAQHYTDGLEFLRFGTPSNNTSAERSGYGAEDVGHERSFATESGAVEVTTRCAIERAAPRRRAGLAGCRHRAGARERRWRQRQARRRSAQHEHSAVAVDVGLFPHQHDRHGRHGAHAGHARVGARSLHRARSQRRAVPAVALWQAAVRCAASHVARLWRPRAGEEAANAPDQWLRSFLISLRDNVWRPRLSDVARLGLRTSPPDPDADLADVMRTDAALEQL